MKTVEQVSEEFANKQGLKYVNSDNYLSNSLYNTTKSNFISGTKWQKEQDRWIRVEERLPKLIEGKNHSEDFPVIINGRKSYGCYYYLRINEHSVEFYWHIYLETDFFSSINVTHWLPTPELPEFLKK